MTQNKKIAVTGGIGSGKSMVCALLKKRGYPVFSCDEINRAMLQDAGYRAELAAAFPACVQDGAFQKELLAAAVFSNEAARKKLDALSHPRIMRTLLARMNEAEGTCFAEVPLLFEGGYENLFDGVIAVRREKEARIRAVRARDGLSEEEIAGRMRRQFPPEKLEEKGCFILENDGDARTLDEKLTRLLRAMGICP